MAGETTPPEGTTRFIETSRGLLSYAQLAPLLAEHVLAVERSIASGAFAAQSLGPELLLDLHSRIAGDLVPDWAGRWRTIEVRVGLSRTVEDSIKALANGFLNHPNNESLSPRFTRSSSTV